MKLEVMYFRKCHACKEMSTVKEETQSASDERFYIQEEAGWAAERCVNASG